jgi:hypothetical protein
VIERRREQLGKLCIYLYDNGADHMPFQHLPESEMKMFRAAVNPGCSILFHARLADHLSLLRADLSR